MFSRNLFVINLLICVYCCLGRDNLRDNSNVDFILNESRTSYNAPKRNYAAPSSPAFNEDVSYNRGNDYSAQFPPLGSGVATHSPNNIFSYGTTISISENGKRDYVNSAFPALRPTSSRAPSPTSPTSGSTQITQSSPNNRRDYVSSSLPSSRTTPTTRYTTNSDNLGLNRISLSTSGRRDYVSSNYPAIRPHDNAGQVGGKVSDLVNFYNNQGNRNTPSYSSILKGPGTDDKKTPTLSTTSRTGMPMQTSTRVTTTSSTIRPVNQSRNPALPTSIVTNNSPNQYSNSGYTSDVEIQTISEELLRKDVNNAAKFITINFQGKTTSGSSEDKAPGPLITIPNDVWNIPSIQTFVPLLDNYERDTLVNEYVTPQEKAEENAFIDAIMSTTVIRHLMTFLKDKGYVTPDPREQRDFLKQLWFNLYSRGKGKISSSAFEHVFVSELKNEEVSGLHNWIYFSKEESANRINYLGYLKYTDFDNKGAVAKIHFIQQGVDKPVNSMFIGTSPELEIALYTLCFVTRSDNDCNLKLGGKDVNVVTHTFRYRSKNYIGSAYPQI